MLTSRAKTDPGAAMAAVGEFYYELRVARRGDAAADEATLRRVTFIKKLQERSSFKTRAAPGSCWSA